MAIFTKHRLFSHIYTLQFMLKSVTGIWIRAIEGDWISISFRLYTGYNTFVIRWTAETGKPELDFGLYYCFQYQHPPVCVFKQTDKQTRVPKCWFGHLDQSGCISVLCIAVDHLITPPWFRHGEPPAPSYLFLNAWPRPWDISEYYMR